MKDNILAVYDDDTNLKLASIIKLNHMTVVSDTELAENLNTSKQNLSNYRRDNRIPYSMLCEICLNKNININWLLDRNKIYSPDDFSRQITKTVNAQNIYLERKNKGFRKYKNLNKRPGYAWAGPSGIIACIAFIIWILTICHDINTKLQKENKELKEKIELMKKTK